MATNNYSRGKVYKLVNNVDNEIYVGSTIQSLAKRKGGHKKTAVEKPYIRVYQHLNTIGWDNVEIVLIESYPCESNDELRARERYWIEKLKPSLNKVMPARTTGEYYQDNFDKIKEKNRKYRQNNADKVKDYQREYRQKNADKITEKEREYRQKNADKIKEYLQKNADKIKEYKRQYYLRKKAEREAQQ